MKSRFANPEERFTHLFKVFSSERFLRREGLGNEVPFFVAPYPPKEELMTEALIEDLLIKPLKKQGIPVLHLNLYDLSIEVLKQNGTWEDILDAEAELSHDEKLETMVGCCDPQNFLIPKIVEKMQETEFSILLLSGAGTVYPFIRSHTIFENLQSKVKEKPVVLLFPGQYNYSEVSGRVLNLFGIFDDDRYYRAFNLDDYLV